MVEAEGKKKGGCCGGGGSSKQPATTAKTDQRIRMQTKSGKGVAQGSSTRGRKLDRTIEAKIILLGESGVGKSSIALRYCVERFDEIQDTTIGAAYLSKSVKVPIPNDPSGLE